VVPKLTSSPSKTPSKAPTKLGNANLRLHQLTTWIDLDGIDVNYNYSVASTESAGFSSPAEMYNSVSRGLVSSVADGVLRTTLIAIAKVQNITTLQKVSSIGTPVTVDISPTMFPTSMPISSRSSASPSFLSLSLQNFVIAIVFGSVGVLILIASCVLVYKQTYLAAPLPPSQINSLNETQIIKEPSFIKSSKDAITNEMQHVTTYDNFDDIYLGQPHKNQGLEVEMMENEFKSYLKRKSIDTLPCNTTTIVNKALQNNNNNRAPKTNVADRRKSHLIEMTGKQSAKSMLTLKPYSIIRKSVTTDEFSPI
jgi:hypothetical protein